MSNPVAHNYILLLLRHTRTSLIPILLICICSNSHKTSSRTPFLRRYFVVEQWRGLKPLRLDDFPRGPPTAHGQDSVRLHPHSPVTLRICTAPFLHTLQKPVWVASLISHLGRKPLSRRAVDVPGGKGPTGWSLWTHWLQKETLQTVWPVFKMELSSLS